MAEAIDWQGQSGKIYRYWIYPIGQAFAAKPGNYIFAKETSPGNWRPVYVGQTSDLSDRLDDDHENMPCIRKNGATHVHAHVNDSGEKGRRGRPYSSLRPGL